MKMRIFILLLFVFCLTGNGTSGGQSAAAQNFSIAVSVNEDAISESDVKDRMKLMMASGGVKPTSANTGKFRQQAIDSLIEEQIKLQEAKRQNINVTEEDVARGFSALAQQNNLSAEQFEQVMTHQGIPKSTLLHQVKSQIAWSKVVTSVLRPEIDVSESDINARMERIRDDLGQTEYLAGEIFLPVGGEPGTSEAEIKALADKIIAEIKSGRAPFKVAAAQFSRSESAARGGDLGWIKAGDLPKELDRVVTSLSDGQISPPIKGLSGYYILTVSERRTADESTMPQPDDVLNTIGLERLTRLQKRYLEDLKSAAFIKYRD
ncbi:MAG: SurA N-terminal domain-containing protein [Alphaproteobacteria bacterium]|nr:SurA N-terminal domain-containing protein [Alphaproteobacteria bacterium]